jgi:hypothetical protein
MEFFPADINGDNSLTVISFLHARCKAARKVKPKPPVKNIKLSDQRFLEIGLKSVNTKVSDTTKKLHNKRLQVK